MLQLNERERRWFDALLVLGTATVAVLLLGLLSSILLYFSDIVLIFFLAWLLAFVLTPITSAMLRAVPGLPRGVAVILTYAILLVALTALVLLVAQAVANSLTSVIQSAPQLQAQLLTILTPWQERLNAIGIQIDLEQAARQLFSSLQSLAQPVTDIAFASLGVLGNVLFIVFLSVYLSIDRERSLTFIYRIVPPRYKDEVQLFEESVARSFGGFLRGQALLGLIYGAIALVTHLLLGLDYTPLSATVAGILQMIPFFGPFISWAPPVVVAVFTKPDAVLPAFIIMAAGWFVVMNILQPRVMGDAVGLHPVVVLGSVIIGVKLAGIAGAIFCVPIAAVLSSFFFYYLSRSTDHRDVASRAARRLEQREGHPVRVPKPPQAGSVAPDEPASLDEAAGPPHAASEPGH